MAAAAVAVGAGAAVAVAPVVVVVVVAGAQAAAVPEGEDGSDEEPDAVDDGEGPARLEHGAGLGGRPADAGAGEAEVAQVGGPAVADGDARAVGITNVSQIARRMLAKHAGDFSRRRM